VSDDLLKIVVEHRVPLALWTAGVVMVMAWLFLAISGRLGKFVLVTERLPNRKASFRTNRHWLAERVCVIYFLLSFPYTVATLGHAAYESFRGPRTPVKRSPAPTSAPYRYHESLPGKKQY
jgi:hypothetical protein